MNDSLKGSYYCEIDQIMMQLYYMYRRSTKKWKELQAVGEALEENVVKPARAQGIRWVDHRRKAVLAISRNYTCLVTQFEDMASGERSDITGEDQDQRLLEAVEIAQVCVLPPLVSGLVGGHG